MAIPTIHMKPSGVKNGTLYSQVPVTKIGDFNVSRGSMATRVNEDGFIETVGYTVGGELVTNGDFATDSDWTKQSGWSISGGSANCDGTQSGGTAIYQSAIQQNKNYKITFSVTDISSGGVGVVNSPKRTSIGTYTYYHYTTSSDSNIYVNADANFVGSIDNVSVIEFAGNDVPRIDYTGGGCPVLLTEPQSTNERLYSENFSVDYSLTRAIVYSDYAFDDGSGTYLMSPDGTSNATIFQDDSSGGNSSSQLFKSASVDVLSTYTFSVFVKKGFNDYIALRTASYTTPVNGQSYFNLDLGTLISEGGGHTARIEDYGNGWYRCSVTFTTDAADTTGNCMLRHSKDGTTSTVPIDGTNSVRVWGWQFEKKDYATSYIPTVGVASTRLGDVVNGAGNASTFNDSEGVLFIEISALSDDLTYRDIEINDGTSSNRIILLYTNISNTIRAIIFDGGVVSVFIDYYIPILNNNKIALKYKLNDCSLWVNGFEVGTDTSATMPSGLNNLSFNNFNGDSLFYGKTKDLQVYDVALTDLELEALTSL